jgi:ubiquinone/menaquinone biosynthesis C-methylase UbiE
MTNFDESAKDWDSDPMKVERALAVAEAIRAAVPLQAGMTALEYGCGTGLVSFALQPDFVSITLADTSQGMLDVLTGKIKAAGVANMHPLRLDLSSGPLPASRFDITYSLLTLHHIPDTDTVLRQFAAILSPGGWLCIADLDSEDGTFHTDGTTDVHLGFDRALLQKKVEAAGFRDVRFSTAFNNKKMIGKVEKVFPIFLLTARKP